MRWPVLLSVWAVSMPLARTTGIPELQQRPTISLDGTWEFSLDPQRQGWASGWHSGNYTLPHRCTVPGAWEAQGFGNQTAHLWRSFQPTNETLASLYPSLSMPEIPLGGLGWYKKTVALTPAPAGNRVFLRVGGVHRSVTAFANGVLLGHHSGYLHELEWDITAQTGVSQGVLVVVLAVDSYHNISADPLMGSFDMGEDPELNGWETDFAGVAGPWGGIWGHVSIESRASIWLGEMFARATNATVVASASVYGDTAAATSVRLSIVDCGIGRMVATTTVQLDRAMDAGGDDGGGQRLTVVATVPASLLKWWSPSEPSLYNATLTLLSPSYSSLNTTSGTADVDDNIGLSAVDVLHARFGVKDLKIVGHQFILNGRKLFLSGFGFDAPYSDTIAAPSDKAYHLRQARLAKSYGFNFVRCHSHFLPPEFYDALDEVGIFVSPELPVVYGFFFQAAIKLGTLAAYKSGWAAAISRHRNHPSIFDWCMGNEGWGCPGPVDNSTCTDFASELRAVAKQLDPARPVMVSDGGFAYPGPGSTYPYKYDGINRLTQLQDFYSVYWPGHVFTVKTLPKPDRPCISHEVGNYNTFPRIAKGIRDMTPPGKASKFTKPFWLSPAHDHLQSIGLLEENDVWSMRSEQLYAYNYKQLVEGIRLSPWMSGYEWWCFAEYWMSGNGIVDYALDAKPGVTAAALKSFVGDMVLLATGATGIVVFPGDIAATQPLPPAFTSGELLSAKLLLSNFGPINMTGDQVKWQVRVNGKSMCSGTGQANATLEQGAITGIGGVVECALPDLGSFPAASPAQTRVPVRLELASTLVASDGKTVLTNNSWSSRLYPTFKDSPAPRPFFTSGGSIGGIEMMQQCMYNNARVLPTGAAGVGPDAVVLTNSLSSDVFAALAQNATVVLVATSEQHLIPTANNAFTSCWWLCGGSVGTVIYQGAHALLEGMDDQGWCDGTWQRLIDGSVAMLMEPVNHTIVEKLGSALQYRNEMVWNPSNATIHIRALPDIASGPHSSSLLFELGKKEELGGRLIATGLNLWPGQYNASLWPGGYEHPEQAYLIWKLLDHAFG